MELANVIATDFCVFSELDVSLTRQGLVFVCGNNEDTDGATSNGSGKTTIFKAITWALYGECVDGDKGDEVIRRGAKKAIVKLNIADGDTTWYVTRTRTKGKPKLTLEREDAEEPDVLHPIKETREQLDERIQNLIGLDFHAFKNTVLYGANDIVKFADPRTKDADRKEMLHCILRTSVLKLAHRKALDRAKEVRGAVAKVDARIERINAGIDEYDVAGLKTLSDGWQSSHDEQIAMNIRQAKVNRDDVEKLKAIDYDLAIAANQRAFDEAEVEHKAASTAGDGLEALDAELDTHRQAYGAMQRKFVKQETRVEAHQEALDGLEEADDCPLCSSPLTEGHAAKHIAALQKERSDARAFMDEIKRQMVTAEAEGKKVGARRKTAMAKVREAEVLSKKLVQIERELRWKEREQTKAAADIETGIKAARMYVERAKELKAETNPHTEAYQAARTRVKALKEQVAEIREERAEHEMMLAHIQFWVKGFSNHGLPSFVLDNVMPIITARANHYLETLADGDVSMDFQTQRELKSAKGEVRDEITIVTTIEGNEGVTPSSGQRTKMNVATDLALMDLVSTREQGHLNILMLDEVLDGLDAEGTERVLMLLQELRTMRDSVFVISHGSSMAEIFERGLRVNKSEGSATVERMS